MVRRIAALLTQDRTQFHQAETSPIAFLLRPSMGFSGTILTSVPTTTTQFAVRSSSDRPPHVDARSHH